MAKKAPPAPKQKVSTTFMKKPKMPKMLNMKALNKPNKSVKIKEIKVKKK